jgi:hypothetical protein
LKPKLNKRIDSLAVRATGKLIAANAVWETGHVDDQLVGVEKLRLAARPVLGLDDERRQSAMGRREASRQSTRTCADDHDVPVR